MAIFHGIRSIRMCFAWATRATLTKSPSMNLHSAPRSTLRLEYEAKARAHSNASWWCRHHLCQGDDESEICRGAASKTQENKFQFAGLDFFTSTGLCLQYRAQVLRLLKP